MILDRVYQILQRLNLVLLSTIDVRFVDLLSLAAYALQFEVVLRLQLLNLSLPIFDFILD